MIIFTEFFFNNDKTISTTKITRKTTTTTTTIRNKKKKLISSYEMNLIKIYVYKTQNHVRIHRAYSADCSLNGRNWCTDAYFRNLGSISYRPTLSSDVA